MIYFHNEEHQARKFDAARVDQLWEKVIKIFGSPIDPVVEEPSLKHIIF